MGGVAIGAGGGNSAAGQSRQTVHAGAIFVCLRLVTGPAAESFMPRPVGTLVRAVAGKAVHCSLPNQRFVNSADEHFSIAAVTAATCVLHCVGAQGGDTVRIGIDSMAAIATGGLSFA